MLTFGLRLERSDCGEMAGVLCIKTVTTTPFGPSASEMNSHDGAQICDHIWRKLDLVKYLIVTG